MAEPVVGKVYEVPAIQVNRWYGWSGFLPIIGGEHEDAEIIGFPADHFHIDWRFASKAVMHHVRFAMAGDKVYGVVAQRHARTHHPNYSGPLEPIVVGEPVTKRMQCKRVLPPYPHGSAPWTHELAAKYADCKIINGKCPHRGVLVSQMIRNGDILTCPGHGLRWNAVTGDSVQPSGEG